MPAEKNLVLLGRAVTPLRRTAVRGTSTLDLAYTALNQATAAVLLLLMAPLLAYIAYRIWRVDGTPVTFAHGRVGQGGKIFRCFKFRSMVRDSQSVLERLLRDDPKARAEWERDQKLRDDPRITSIGHLLRRTSLDELPQLVNVLRGEMHLVGPRPVTLQEVRRYGARRRHYLSVKPGLTGLWQVSGRNNTTYEERVGHDTDYVEKRNPLLDLWIVTRTVKVLVTRDGAH